MYKSLVEKMQTTLGSLFKMAADLSAILDHPLTQMQKGENGWSGPLEQRLRTFNLFCAAFVKANLEPPSMEEALWRASLPHIWDAKRYESAEKKAKVVKSHVRKHLKGHNTLAASQARALMDTLVLFPECDGYSGINKANIMAMLNRLVVDELGLPPIRPDYAAISLPEPLHQSGPARTTSVLVVDDGIPELMKSALALAGIPNLEVRFLHYEARDSYRKLEGEARDAKLAELATAVIEEEPDIVLMDQGLGNIEGHMLVKAIKARNGAQPIFVANTGGEANELERAGCRENFSKGERTRGMFSAIQYMA